MAAKVRPKDAGVILMAVMDAEELLEEVVDDELLHAAARRPRVQTPAVMTNFLLICRKETTLFSESSQQSLPATAGGRAAIAAHQALFPDPRGLYINGSSTSHNAC
jgi:hypothetical protein